MGDLIRHLGKALLQDNNNSFYNIELNKGDKEDIIHIQTPSFRMELTEDEFREIAISVIEAERKLRSYKNL